MFRANIEEGLGHCGKTKEMGQENDLGTGAPQHRIQLHGIRPEIFEADIDQVQVEPTLHHRGYIGRPCNGLADDRAGTVQFLHRGYQQKIRRRA